MPAPYPADKVEAWKDQICALYAEGKSVPAIAATKDMPRASTIYRWFTLDSDFHQKCIRARHKVVSAKILAVETSED